MLCYKIVAADPALQFYLDLYLFYVRRGKRESIPLYRKSPLPIDTLADPIELQGTMPVFVYSIEFFADSYNQVVDYQPSSLYK